MKIWRVKMCSGRWLPATGLCYGLRTKTFYCSYI